MNEFPTMTNLGGFNALIILKGAGGNREDSMEPLNRRGGGLGSILREGKDGHFLFLKNSMQIGFGYKTILQTAEQEAGFLGG